MAGVITQETYASVVKDLLPAKMEDLPNIALQYDIGLDAIVSMYSQVQ